MKNYCRNACFGVALLVMAGIFASPACAHQKHPFNEKVRAAQMRLADLGYYVGYSDGVIGPATKTGIKNFQRLHGLKPTGQLTVKTFKLLCMTDYMAHHYYLASSNTGINGYYTGYPYNRPGYLNPENGAWTVRGRDR